MSEWKDIKTADLTAKRWKGADNMEDHCVRCGAVIPEGRQLCPKCDDRAETFRVRSVFARQLRKLREDARLTRRQVAKECGICESKLQSYEQCSAQPSLEPLLQLAYFFGVSLDELCGLDSYIVTMDGK